jgi:hypothetical protein
MNSYEESGDTSNKDPENEDSPLTSLEIIELNSDSRKRKTHKFKWKDWIDYGYISILISWLYLHFCFQQDHLLQKIWIIIN